MMVDQLLQAISQAGGHVTVDNGDLVLKAARSLPDDLLAELKAHKPEILAALARPNLSGVSPKFAARLSAEDLRTSQRVISRWTPSRRLNRLRSPGRPPTSRNHLRSVQVSWNTTPRYHGTRPSLRRPR